LARGERPEAPNILSPKRVQTTYGNEGRKKRKKRKVFAEKAGEGPETKQAGGPEQSLLIGEQAREDNTGKKRQEKKNQDGNKKQIPGNSETYTRKTAPRPKRGKHRSMQIGGNGGPSKGGHSREDKSIGDPQLK